MNEQKKREKKITPFIITKVHLSAQQQKMYDELRVRDVYPYGEKSASEPRIRMR